MECRVTPFSFVPAVFHLRRIWSRWLCRYWCLQCPQLVCGSRRHQAGGAAVRSRARCTRQDGFRSSGMSKSHTNTYVYQAMYAVIFLG